MLRAATAVLLLIFPLFGAVTRLYLKDGSYHLVREFKREGDRIRFYSTERSDWEEIPAELVDLRKTESELEGKKAALSEEARILSEEDKAVRAQQEEILKIPQDPGVYTLKDGKELQIFKAAESKVHTNKGRSLLKAAVPVPLILGKATVEVDGDHSINIIADERQEFYLQLQKDEGFGMIKLTPHHGVRIAERVSIVPVANENVEEVEEIETFRKQLTEGGLYKIWPAKALAPGEYAIIEYTPGKLNAQLWDFQFKK